MFNSNIKLLPKDFQNWRIGIKDKQLKKQVERYIALFSLKAKEWVVVNGSGSQATQIKEMLETLENDQTTIVYPADDGWEAIKEMGTNGWDEVEDDEEVVEL